MAKRRKTSGFPRRPDGALCITFVNTASGQRKALETYEDLLAWSVAAGALGTAEAPRLARAAREVPGPASGVVRKSRTLCERLGRLILASASGNKPETGDFVAFNTELSAALAARQLVNTPSGYQWAWGEREDDLDRMLWPVLLSAADLLASGDVSKVRQCPREDCGLLFVAKGGGRPRKWCSAACGSRSTSNNYYQRRVRPRRERIKQELQGRQASRLAGYSEGGKLAGALDEG